MILTPASFVLILPLLFIPDLPKTAPEKVGMSSQELSRIDSVVEEGLAAKLAPGCVVLIGRGGKVVFNKAYGYRRINPEKKPMTTDTVFDLASLTKPIATAMSIMLLAERGAIRIEDKVIRHLPEFGLKNKDEITISQLLLHKGGLIPDNSLSDYNDGPEDAWRNICALELFKPPGEEFIYTDVGYIVLARLVERVSGLDIHAFTQKNLFYPLGMTETGYLPDASLRNRAAATEKRNGKWMQGEVHDPRAYLLGGIAGHAGLFSTAADLAVYAQMMLNQGRHGDGFILDTATVARMIKAHPVSSGYRALGWDIDSSYSSNRGKTFSPTAFGHGGFTGTSIWIDPGLDLFVVFLSNRVHLKNKLSVNRLAGRIGDIAANAIINTDEVCTLCGIDMLERDSYSPLSGRRIGLIANHTSVNRFGSQTSRLLRDAGNLTVVALFSPEHGQNGVLDQLQINDSRDETLDLPVYSLYGKTRRPTEAMLKGIDTLVFDIQDIGARFYTYISTMGYAMEAAAEHGIKFMVLDRPNPITGTVVEGSLLDNGKESFVGYHSLPVRHGMTAGELALMFNSELNLGVDLKIIKCERWRRSSYFDATGLKWINPSPNMRSLTQALLYPGVGLLEMTNLSVGRGTDSPFEIIGAPWMDCRKLARRLNNAQLPGVRFTPVTFKPKESRFASMQCHGVNIIVTDRKSFQSVRTGMEIACSIHEMFPNSWDIKALNNLLKSDKVFEAVKAGKSSSEIMSQLQPELDAFLRRRIPFLLYN